MATLKLFILSFIATVALSFWFGGPEPTLIPYNVAASKDYARLSAAALCPKACIEGWNCKGAEGINLTDITYISSALTKAAGYVGYYSARNQIILALKGSTGIQNWIEQSNWEPTPYIYCLHCFIHTGLYGDYTLLHGQVQDKISILLNKYPGAKIVAIGYSLGGSLSQIGALELRRVNDKLTSSDF